MRNNELEEAGRLMKIRQRLFELNCRSNALGQTVRTRCDSLFGEHPQTEEPAAIPPEPDGHLAGIEAALEVLEDTLGYACRQVDRLTGL